MARTLLLHVRPMLPALFAEALERGDWITFHARPRSALRVGTVSDAIVKPHAVGVVLQGPIRAEDDFTIETVRLYRRHFPDHPIIVSTWVDADETQVRRIRELGATVLLNAKPQSAGVANINYQLVSTTAGVEHCDALGVDYVLKTRTDQRIYAPNTLEFLCQLIKAFPLKVQCGQSARIVSIGLNTFRFRLYGVSDQLVFGTTRDMVVYWSPPLDVRQRDGLGAHFTWGEHSRANLVEVYIVTEYLKRIGRQALWTLQDSWQVYADHFCIIDQHSIDLFWPKYERHTEFRRLSYDHIRAHQELSFRDWLLLYSGQIDLAAAPLQALDRRQDEPVFENDAVLALSRK